MTVLPASVRALSPVTIIPARLAATRLPSKPLAEIGGLPMIVQVWRRACEADIGPVLVACADPEIALVVRDAGGEAVLTDPALPSGSDRVRAALQRVDPAGRHGAVVNLQGDLPTLPPTAIRRALALLEDPLVDIGTLAAPAADDERDDPNVVKAAIEPPEGAARGRALYFSRAPVPAGAGRLLHHVGLYAFRRNALERFVGLPAAAIEQRERLEQLRALAAGLRIEVAVIDAVPLGVDTPADLARARTLLGGPGGARLRAVPDGRAGPELGP